MRVNRKKNTKPEILLLILEQMLMFITISLWCWHH